MKELDPTPRKIKRLPAKSRRKELDPKQGVLDLRIECERDIDGIGMGVLSDGTPFLTGRGLARLIDIENLHIRTISQDWGESPQKPRISGIKDILAKRGISVAAPHIAVNDGHRIIHAFPDVVCLAVLEYYAFDAAKPRQAARDNFRALAGHALRDFIYSNVGYDPTGRHQDKFAKWHERLALNHQAAPKGFFHVFNEAHTIVYEMIMAGAPIDERTIVDGSIGIHWSKYWEENDLSNRFGRRAKYPHNYPDSHPQSKANPHQSWCYPLPALGHYREWLQDIYVGGGKFRKYIESKMKKGHLPPSVAQLTIEAIEPKQIEG